MIGAIAGDIVGSVYEHHRIKTKDFPLFHPRARFTDDTVLTVAIADAILSGEAYASALKRHGRMYPHAGYGEAFHRWLRSADSEPYGSWGNGSAMRVSPVGLAFDSVKEVLAEAERSAAVTHDHPEGIRGAQAVALGVFLARTGHSRQSIRDEITVRFGYDLDRTLDEIRPGYRFDVSCQGSVPESILAFLESTDFEDALRKAVSLGGDSDTMACIAGSIAQAFYGGVPNSIAEAVRVRLPMDYLRILDEFDAIYPRDPNSRGAAFGTSTAEPAIRRCEEGSESPSFRTIEKTVQPSRSDRVKGCLLAGACGDALGAPVEFLELADIRRRYGQAGIRDFDSAYGRVGAITDDTQMTLFTAEGCIRSWVRGVLKGISDPPSVVHHAYLRWLRSQGETTSTGLEIVMDGWLIGVEALWERRAPGNTCLSALRQCHRFGQRAQNHSKGCGGVMRVAPVGLTGLAGGAEEAFDLGCELANLTHGHPSGFLASGFQAAVITLLLAGGDLEGAADEATLLLRKQERHEEVLRSVSSARELAWLGPSSQRVAELGRGWVAEEALGISLFCALACPALESAVRLAVNHSGDSDSTGAITGHLVGAMFGAKAIPARWIDQLELRAEIEILGRDLAAIASKSPARVDEMVERYPGW